MRHSTQLICLSLVVAFSEANYVRAQVAPRNVAIMRNYPDGPSPAEGYLNGLAENSYARAANVSAQAMAQAEIMKAQAENIKAVAMSVEAHGKAAESYARAAEVQEKARSLALDNKVKTAQAFYDKRKAHDAYVTAHARKSPGTPAARYGSNSKSAKRLERHEYDPSSGKIRWPAVFEREEFQEYRVQLDRLFAQSRPIETGSSGNFEGRVRGTAGKMHSQLRDIIKDMPPAEYVAASRFLTGLMQEAQLPRPIEGLAAN